MSTGTILFLILLVLAPLSMMLMHGRGGHGTHGGLGRGGCGGHSGHGGHGHGRPTGEGAGQPAEGDERRVDDSGFKAPSRESDGGRRERGRCH